MFELCEDNLVKFTKLQRKKLLQKMEDVMFTSEALKNKLSSPTANEPMSIVISFANTIMSLPAGYSGVYSVIRHATIATLLLPGCGSPNTCKQHINTLTQKIGNYNESLKEGKILTKVTVQVQRQ